MSVHPAPTARRGAWLAPVRGLLGAYIAVLAAMVLNPSPATPGGLVTAFSEVAMRMGLPVSMAHPARMEFLLNIAAFMPVSFLAAWLWPRPAWHQWLAWGFIASFGIEVFQALFLDGRSATHSDVVANSLGALAGWLALRAVNGFLPPGLRLPSGRDDPS